MTSSIKIRPATQNDVEAITAILNTYLQNGVETLHEHDYTHDDISARLEMMSKNGYGAFVADDNGVVGFAWYQQFRAQSGYRLSMEHSVYLKSGEIGRGVGSALYRKIEDDARAKGFHSFTGVVTKSNTKSIAFHEKHGFVEAGRLRENGYKFDTWHEIVFLYKILT